MYNQFSVIYLLLKHTEFITVQVTPSINILIHLKKEVVRMKGLEGNPLKIFPVK